MLSFDKPTPKDKLGFEPYVKGIEDFVRNIKPEDLPVAVGIYGAWGSGKTSFMLQLKDCLENQLKEGKLHLATVWFDAWKYDCTHDVRSALIYKILFDIERETTGNIKSKIHKTISKTAELTKGIVEQTSISAGIPGSISLNLPTPQEVTNRIDSYRNFQTTVDKFAEDFAKAIRSFLKSRRKMDKQKLVVFIDDLDRCLPENVIVILEALKLFLIDSPCVFVIGVDRTVVEKAIQVHYGTDPGVSGRDYLDKIIQYPFIVPHADQAKLERHFEQLLETRSILDDKCRHIIKLVAGGNPRTYLRILSNWELTCALAKQVNADLVSDNNLHILMIATVIQIRFPQLGEACQRNPEGLKILTQLCRDINVGSSAEVEKLFINNNCHEYYELWKNGSIRQFLGGLIPTVGGNANQIFGAPELLKAALNLTARIG